MTNDEIARHLVGQLAELLRDGSGPQAAQVIKAELDRLDAMRRGLMQTPAMTPPESKPRGRFLYYDDDQPVFASE